MCRSEVKVKGQPWVPPSQVPSNSLFFETDYLAAWNLPSTLVQLASSGISLCPPAQHWAQWIRTCGFGRAPCISIQKKSLILGLNDHSTAFPCSEWQDSSRVRIFSGMQTPRLGIIKRNFSGSLNWDKLNLAPLLSGKTRSDLKQRGKIIDRGGEEDEGDLVFNSTAQHRNCLFSAILSTHSAWYSFSSHHFELAFSPWNLQNTKQEWGRGTEGKKKLITNNQTTKQNKQKNRKREGKTLK